VQPGLRWAAAKLADRPREGSPDEFRPLAALGAIELALAEAGMPHARGGVEVAMHALRAPAAVRIAAVAEVQHRPKPFVAAPS
jgi:hypothetical protein